MAQRHKIIQHAGKSPENHPAFSMHRLMARAFQYNAMVMKSDGRSIAKLAIDAEVSPAYFVRVFRLSFLAPDVVQAILRNDHSLEMTAKRLANETDVPVSWDAQRGLFKAN